MLASITSFYQKAAKSVKRRVVTLTATALVLLAGAIFSAGCTALERIQDNSASVKVTVQYATLKVLDGDEAKAARTVEILEEARVTLSQTSDVAVGQAMEYIRAQIDFSSLDQADQLLITAVIDEVEVELINRFGDGILNEQNQESLDAVAQWIIQAARLV